MGSLAAIAISHPHYYTTIVEWSRAFGSIPVYLHAADWTHVVRPDPVLQFWEGERLSLLDDLTLIRCGGHFAGGSVLHWPGGADGKGVLLTGDIIQVVPDRKVSFMYSYPNLIPLPAPQVRRIVAAVDPFSFDRIYGAWWSRSIIGKDAKATLLRSAERYIHWLEGK